MKPSHRAAPPRPRAAAALARISHEPLAVATSAAERCGLASALVLLVLAAVPAAASGPPPATDEPAAVAPAAASGRLLDLAAIYSPDRSQRLDLGGSLVLEVEWLDDRRFTYGVSPLLDPSVGWQPPKVWEIGAGERPLYDPAAMAKDFAELPGVGAEGAREMSRGRLVWSRDGSAALVRHADDLFLWRRKGGASRLTAGPEVEEEAGFSPDGRLVSFVRGGDLWLIEPASGRERALTTGGGGAVTYGRLDWVYQEELYGRHDYRGYWWSPDSTRIALLRFDESAVPRHTLVDPVPWQSELEVTAYPQAGQPNSAVRLGVVPAVGGEVSWADLGRYQASDHLIVRVGWWEDSSRVTFEVQDREQTWLELGLADPATGETTVLLRETSPAAVERLEGERAHFLADGSFVWLGVRLEGEERGFPHLDLYSAEGHHRRRLTGGAWEVREVYGVDEGRRLVYFLGTPEGATGGGIYRLALDPAADGADPRPERLSAPGGTHKASFAPGLGHYVDIWSALPTPPQVRLHAADGGELAAVDATRPGDFDGIRWGAVERHTVEARDGFPLEAMLIKPPDFDPAKRYPVLVYHYGGPHAQTVVDAWGGRRYLWHQMLAQRGILVFSCDNRSASGKGWAPVWEAYGRMGVVELRDTEDCLDWLESHPWVDPERTGVWGWSYGGFLTAFALTHSERFEVGVVGAPVADWRLYDSIYTERYMKMPQRNPEGYRETSAIEAAADLHGALLLIHGTMDDNVHPQNTLKLAYALQKAGKQFRLMLYPQSRHGVADPDQVHHLFELMTGFLTEHLRPDSP